jgi:general stress protein YciG
LAREARTTSFLTNGVRMQSGTRNRGFASMDPEKQREIARKGGRAAHEKGTAHEFTPDEARAAGRKGGERVSANRDHMSRIGRLGGKHSAGRRQTSREGGNGSAPGTENASEASETDNSGEREEQEAGTFG